MFLKGNRIKKAFCNLRGLQVKNRMVNDSVYKISAPDLEVLISTLDVQFVWLSHCLVSPGFRLDMGGIGFPGIHYNIKGYGLLQVAGQQPIELAPHTLIVVPPNSPFKIEVPDERRTGADPETVHARDVIEKKNGIYQFVAGDPGAAEINFVCGFFRASYGQSTDLFGGLNEPILEKFGATEGVDVRLRSAVAEFLGHEIGSDAMSATLLKQVIILLLRRSLVSMELWTERFRILRDPRISRVLAAMAADPGGNHTVQSLAAIALMSRSAFMSLFGEILGRPPIEVLRDLRMRHAAQLLRCTCLSIDQVAGDCGYQSKTSFARAFRDAHSKLPADYRAQFTKE
jgi:AraC-like DNA-binding protein